MKLDMSDLNSLKIIGQYSFYKCIELTNIYIYENVTTLGKNAFFGCSNVNEIYYDAVAITNSSTSTVLGSVGENVYLNNGLKLIIGENAKEIPAYFMDEGYLTSIDASNANYLEKIGEYAFNNCTNLTDVKLPSNLEKIGNYAFNNCKLMNMDFSLLVNLTAIGEHAFYGCDKLTNVYIGENVTSIGISAFNSCDSITSIVFEHRNIIFINYFWNFVFCHNPVSTTKIPGTGSCFAGPGSSIKRKAHNQFFCWNCFLGIFHNLAAPFYRSNRTRAATRPVFIISHYKNTVAVIGNLSIRVNIF